MTKPKSQMAKGGSKGGGKSKAAERSPSVAAAEAPARPEASELERKRLAVAEELSNVERQIYDLETKYLEQSSPFGNAVRGYEGFLGGVSAANKKVTAKPDERLFSWSSLTGQVQQQRR